MDTETQLNQKAQKKNQVIKFIAFILTSCFLFCYISRVMIVDTANYEYALMTSIYKERQRLSLYC